MANVFYKLAISLQPTHPLTLLAWYSTTGPSLKFQDANVVAPIYLQDRPLNPGREEV